MIFVDASALVSILAKEPDAIELAEILYADPDRIISALSVWETFAALCRNYAFNTGEAERRIADFRAFSGLRLIPIAEPEMQLAFAAYARFGKGRHKAALNMGDCFAYACAKANNAKLLFKGEDFSKTDIAVA